MNSGLFVTLEMEEQDESIALWDSFLCSILTHSLL